MARTLTGFGFLEQNAIDHCRTALYAELLRQRRLRSDQHVVHGLLGWRTNSSVSNAIPGFTQYTFDVVGDALDPTTQLFFDFAGSGAQFIDQVSITPTPGPAT